jgi:hypothetical protein
MIEGIGNLVEGVGNLIKSIGNFIQGTWDLKGCLNYLILT